MVTKHDQRDDFKARREPQKTAAIPFSSIGARRRPPLTQSASGLGYVRVEARVDARGVYFAVCHCSGVVVRASYRTLEAADDAAVKYARAHRCLYSPTWLVGKDGAQ
jgi:hypothetical protein